jgi:hypothetical protein
MVLVASATVGGLFLAVIDGFRSVLCFGFASAYLARRTVLRVRRKLSGAASIRILL